MNETQFRIELSTERERHATATKHMLEDIVTYIEECEKTEGLSEQTTYFLALARNKVEGYL